MKRCAALLVALAANHGLAATAYVTDELVLGLYADPSTQGQRLATLHSGATLDTLATKGDATQVQLMDGMVGWVKSAYLTSRAPASVRLKDLQDELDRRGATSAGLAEAAARSESSRLRALLARADSGGEPAIAAPGFRMGMLWACSVIVAAGSGFWLGYASLARRIKGKFGGIKVY